MINTTGDGALIKVKVAVKPEVELGEYKGLEAEKPAVEVKDEEAVSYTHLDACGRVREIRHMENAFDAQDYR